MSGFCTSAHAFGPYLTRESTKALHRIYREMHFKRFHYSNAAMDFDGNYIDFYSYYTRVCSIYVPILNSTRPILRVYPFIFDRDNFPNSPTTNKQLNKFLKEYIDADISAYDLRRIYKTLIADSTAPTLNTYNGVDVRLDFSSANYYISEHHIRQCNSNATQHTPCIIDDGYYVTDFEV